MPNQGRNVLSKTKSTNVSIGLTINGILDRPIPVVVHFLVDFDKLVLRLSAYRLKAHIRFMVKP